MEQAPLVGMYVRYGPGRWNCSQVYNVRGDRFQCCGGAWINWKDPKVQPDLDAPAGFAYVDVDGPKLYSWEQINAFIAELRGRGRQVFGKDYSDPSYDV